MLGKGLIYFCLNSKISVFKCAENVVFLDFCESKLTEKAKLLKVKRQLTLVLSFATVFQLKCLIEVSH